MIDNPTGWRVSEGTSEADIAAAKAFAERVDGYKTACGFENIKMRFRTESGAIVTVVTVGQMTKISVSPQIIEHYSKVDSYRTGFAFGLMPMLYSGVIKKARIPVEQKTIQLDVSADTRKRASGYSKLVKPLPVDNLEKFNIDPDHIRFPEFQDEPVRLKDTQFANIRPGWYTGAMREVVQISLGFGRNDDKLPKEERRQLVIPAAVVRRIVSEVGQNVLLPGFYGWPPADGKLQFDYKHYNTDAIAFDSGQNPWLIKVTSGIGTYPAGVWAMPLPIIQASRTDAFLAWMQEVGDEEIIKIIERFKGVPSGEGFPGTKKDFDAWRKAGVIVKVCETADYFDHQPFASPLGFSFNTVGSAAAATCGNYDDAEGLQYGMLYLMRLRLGVASDNGRLPPIDKAFSGLEDAQLMDKYLSSIYEQLGEPSPANLAVKYKIRRHSPQEILAKAEAGFSVNQWRDLDMDPIASHSGNVWRESRGWLYHPAKFDYQPKIRLPEPFGKPRGCYPVDLSPLINGRYKDKYPRCDTVVYAHYVGDDLKLIKYFRDETEVQEPQEPDGSGCPEFGKYEYIIAHSKSRIYGDFYTSDFDDRELSPESWSKITGERTDLGFDDPPYFGFNPYFGTAAYVSRNRYIEDNSVVTLAGGFWNQAMVMVPWLDRSSHLYSIKGGAMEGYEITGRQWLSVTDPHQHVVWTYHKNRAWINYEGFSASPWPVDGRPVLYGRYIYAPHGCSHIADDGHWEPDLDQLAALIQPNSSTWAYSGGSSPPKWSPTSSTKQLGEREVFNKGLHFVYKASPIKLPHEAHTRYFNGDFMLGPWSSTVTQNAFGNAQYTFLSEPFVGETVYGHTKFADGKTPPIFIGVINE
jgi:hypothetical protein